MKIKYMIHRSEKPFLEAKELFRRMTAFYVRRYPALEFIDQGKRFSVRMGTTAIDFDHGYYRMNERSFKSYDLVISTGMFAVLSPTLTSGSIAIPHSYDRMIIDKKRSRVQITTTKREFANPMEKIISEMARYEKAIGAAIRKELRDPSLTLRKIPIKRKAKMINCNTVFLPSELKCAAVSADGKGIKMREWLEKRYDGLNCEGGGMMQQAKGKLVMFSVGLDKPYHTVELTDSLRTAKGLKNLPDFRIEHHYYFQYLFFGYLLEKEIKTKKKAEWILSSVPSTHRRILPASRSPQRPSP